MATGLRRACGGLGCDQLCGLIRLGDGVSTSVDLFVCGLQVVGPLLGETFFVVDGFEPHGGSHLVLEVAELGV